MKYPLLIILVVFLSCIGSKTSSKNKLSKKSHQFIEFEDFEIRKKPILNREYIILLCWYIDVYGLSYPNKVFEILPKNSLNYTPDCSNGFEPLFSSINPNSVLKNYILNPKFLNYPLVGLSEFQVMELENWLYDRYNESSLIKNHYLNYNSEQKDEDCFTTEAFVVGQYMGDVKKDCNLNWNKNEFKFIFRLPYLDELNKISKEVEFDDNLIEYSFNSKDFLWQWDQQYISSNNKQNTLTLKLFYAPILIFDFSWPEEIFKNTYSCASLTNKENGFTNVQYLKSENSDPYPYPEKEFDGRMKFVVVGRNDKMQPIIADRIYTNKSKIMEHKIFRIVSNTKVKKEYWP